MSDPYEKVLLNLSMKVSTGSYHACGDGNGASGLTDARGLNDMSTVVGSPIKGRQPIKRRSPGTLKNGNHSVESDTYETSNGFKAVGFHGATNVLLEFTFMFETYDPRVTTGNTNDWSGSEFVVGWGNDTRPTAALIIEPLSRFPILYGKPNTGQSYNIPASSENDKRLKIGVPYHASMIYGGSGPFDLYVNGVQLIPTGATTIPIATSLLAVMFDNGTLSGVSGSNFRGRVERVMATQDARVIRSIQPKFMNMHKVWLQRKRSNRGM